MTAPVPPSRTNTAVSVLVGLGLFGVAMYFEILEMKSPPTHTSHVAMFAGGMLFGILIAFRAYVFPVIQQIVVIAGPYLPDVRIGGNRKSDPPKDG